jgi:hypothetical protein
MQEASPSPGAAGTSVAVAYRDCVVDALSGAIERERAKDNQALARCFLQLYEVRPLQLMGTLWAWEAAGASCLWLPRTLQAVPNSALQLIALAHRPGMPDGDHV